MANVPNYIKKTLRFKPEVHKIYDDLEKWLDHCRFNLLPFNPADLYKSKEYKEYIRAQRYAEQNKARREHWAQQNEQKHKK
jgi:NAD+--asparagine ADP-ribosyltransferase